MRGRYAPSPTGLLHLGNARTALLAWLQARSAGGEFVMRVEDLDAQRSRPEFEAEQLADLRWLGIDWDEGPDVGGPHGPYRQSERDEHYASALKELEHYPCSCTRRELREISSAPHGSEVVYPGLCRGGPKRSGKQLAIRWRLPKGADSNRKLAFEDLILGRREQDLEREVGDFILRRADGAWAYQLAVVVDDAAMEIDHVFRGADLIDSTPRQILLQRALEFPTPRYAHAPLVLGPDGQKLNKRHGAPDLKSLRDAGVDPGRVIAFLAKSSGLLASAKIHSISARELVQDFDLSRIPKTAHRLTPLDLTAIHDLA